MPTYEYRCEQCGYEFEQFQAITARSLRKCPECGRNGLKRLLGAGAGVIFKGSGFYQTDYRSESYKKGQNSEKESKDKEKSVTKTKGKTKNSKSASKDEKSSR